MGGPELPWQAPTWDLSVENSKGNSYSAGQGVGMSAVSPSIA
jgi:hypothetical protein